MTDHLECALCGDDYPSECSCPRKTCPQCGGDGEHRVAGRTWDCWACAGTGEIPDERLLVPGGEG